MMKKLLAVATVFCLICAIFVGCQMFPSAEKLISKAETRFDTSKSLEGKVSAEMMLNWEERDVPIHIKANTDMQIYFNKPSDSASFDGEVRLDLGDYNQTMPVKTYVVKEGENTVEYYKDDYSWVVYRDCEYDPFEGMNNIFNFVVQNKDKFTLSDEPVLVNDIEFYEISAEMPADFVRNAIFAILGDANRAPLPKNASAKIKVLFNKETQEIYSMNISIDEFYDEISKSKTSDFKVNIVFVAFDNVDPISVPNEVKVNATDFNSYNAQAGEIIKDEPNDSASNVADYPEAFTIAGPYVNDSTDFNKVSINGRMLQLPCNMDQIVVSGLSIDEEYLTETLKPYQNAVMSVGHKEDSYVGLFVYNPTDKDISIVEGKIYGIAFHKDHSENFDFEIVGHFNFDTKYSDFYDKFGKPTSEYVSPQFNSCMWSTPDNQYSVIVSFSIDPKAPQHITVMNNYMLTDSAN